MYVKVTKEMLLALGYPASSFMAWASVHTPTQHYARAGRAERLTKIHKYIGNTAFTSMVPLWYLADLTHDLTLWAHLQNGII